MSPYFKGPDKQDKRIWNNALELLQGLSWTRDRLENDDYSGEKQHPIDASNVEHHMITLFRSSSLKERHADPRYDDLLNRLNDIEIALRTEELTCQNIAALVRRLREAKLFAALPMDQEFPERMEYTDDEMYQEP